MDTKELIKFHRSEIDRLEKSIENKKLGDYQYLVGKYFLLPMDECLLIKSVDYVFDEDSIYDINVVGFIADKSSIISKISRNLSLDDLENEITKEKFIQYFDVFVNNLKEKINQQLIK